MNNAVFMNTKDHTAARGQLRLDELGDEDVLVRSKVVGLCRSDIELLHGHLDAQLPVLEPIVPGHEWSGIVESVGRDVHHIKPGDRVVGECVIADNHWFGFTYHGAASETFVVPERLLHVFPETFSYAQAALIEPFTIAYNAIKEIGGVSPGDSVVVIGAGMVGLSSAAIAVGFGADVTVIDRVEERLQLARQLGAARTIDNIEAAFESADLVIEASGSAIGIASTFELAKFGGRVVNIGICAERQITAPLHLIQAKNLQIRGVTGSAGVWPEAIEFLQAKNIDLSPVITATYPLDQVDEAIAATDQGNVKVQLTVGGDGE